MAHSKRFLSSRLILVLLLCATPISVIAGGPRGHWSSAGSLTAARHAHTATLLADGTVFVAGYGFSTTERYDPGVGAWTATEPCPETLVGQSTTIVANGQVLVAGGGGGVPKAAWLFDPAADRWISTGSLAKARSEHTATRLADGRVLVVGGETRQRGRWRATAAAEIYDQTTGRWTKARPMSTPRRLHTAALLADGRVLVVGGVGRDLIPLASAEVYDPPTDRWTRVDPMSEPRIFHTLSILADGRALVVGGSPHPLSSSGVELFDPTDGTWRSAAPLPDTRHSHTATIMRDGRVLIAGGVGPGDPPGTGEFLATALIYDPAADSWKPTDAMSVPRVEHTATLLDDGRVLVTGGLGPEAGATSEIFDPN